MQESGDLQYLRNYVSLFLSWPQSEHLRLYIYLIPGDFLLQWLEAGGMQANCQSPAHCKIRRLQIYLSKDSLPIKLDRVATNAIF